MAVDSEGNVYVTDTANYEVRKITPAGVVTTLAGSAFGFSDGTGTAAEFETPQGVAVDSTGNVYVTDSEYTYVSQTENYTTYYVRKITPSGVVTTLSEHPSAGFANPLGLAVDNAGNVYVADTGNNEIYEITSSGTWLATLAGSTTQGSGFANGTGSAATFNAPSGMAFDTAGNLYVADTNNNEIRKITTASISIANLIGSDTSAFTESYTTSAPGTGETLTPSGSVSDGDNGNDYAVTWVNNTTGVITPPTGTATLTTVSTSLSSVVYGGSVTFTATVTATSGSAASPRREASISPIRPPARILETVPSSSSAAPRDRHPHRHGQRCRPVQGQLRRHHHRHLFARLGLR